MKISPLMLSFALGVAVASAQALAQTPAPLSTQPAPRCFSMHDFESWKSPDPNTIYVRVGLSRYYRLDLSAPCQALKMVGSHLVTKTRGSDQVCSGLDWDLTVSDATSIGGPGIREACIVKTQTPLSPADVAAIPKKFKP